MVPGNWDGTVRLIEQLEWTAHGSPHMHMHAYVVASHMRPTVLRVAARTYDGLTQCGTRRHALAEELISVGS